MVNGISNYNYNTYPAFYRATAGAVIINQNEIQNLIKFAQGQPITTVEEPSIAQAALGTLPFAGIIGGFQGIMAVKNNGLSGKELETYNAAKKAGTAPSMTLSEKFAATFNNLKQQYPYTRGEALKAGSDFVKKEYGDFFKSKTVANETRLPFGLGKAMDKIPGYARLRETGFGKAMGRSGAGFMAVIDGAIKTFTEVIPTFQKLGFSAGMTQIAKSSTEVGLGAIGWLAGDAAGMAIGAAIGTAICPGVGTAIGGFLGRFVIGAVGGATASKLSKVITGKSELEKAQDKQNEQLAKTIEQDANAKLNLAQQTLAQANEILAQDPQNQDALIAKNTAEKIISEQQAQQEVIEQEIETPTQEEMKSNSIQSFKGFSGIPPVPGFNGYSYDMDQFRAALSDTTTYMNGKAINPFI